MPNCEDCPAFETCPAGVTRDSSACAAEFAAAEYAAHKTPEELGADERREDGWLDFGGTLWADWVFSKWALFPVPPAEDEKEGAFNG